MYVGARVNKEFIFVPFSKENFHDKNSEWLTPKRLKAAQNSLQKLCTYITNTYVYVIFNPECICIFLSPFLHTLLATLKLDPSIITRAGICSVVERSLEIVKLCTCTTVQLRLTRAWQLFPFFLGGVTFLVELHSTKTHFVRNRKSPN
jgi:hypothetical protein